MNIEYLRSFSFPEEGTRYFLALEEKAKSMGLYNELEDFGKNLADGHICFDELREKAAVFGCLDENRDTLCMLLTLEAGILLKEKYLQAGFGEELYIATMTDCTSKALECKSCHGVWGTFVESWFQGAFSMKRFALGRFQYEMDTLPRRIFLGDGTEIPLGAPAVCLHIPSGQGSMTDSVRLASYRMAWEFFRQRDYLFHGLMIVMCESWLLYPGLRDFLPKESNVLRFMDDFTITAKREDPVGFENGWRLFGGAWGDDTSPVPRDVNALPESCSLFRAYKKRLLSQGKCGEGEGYFIFDGEKIIR